MFNVIWYYDTSGKFLWSLKNYPDNQCNSFFLINLRLLVGVERLLLDKKRLQAVLPSPVLFFPPTKDRGLMRTQNDSAQTYQCSSTCESNFFIRAICPKW